MFAHFGAAAAGMRPKADAGERLRKPKTQAASDAAG